MPKVTDLEELEIAIRLTAEDADPRTPSIQLAREFYGEHRELVAGVADQWITEKLAKLIQQRRLIARREANQQLVIEGMLGFTRLPKRIEVRPGELVPRAQATSAVFRKLVAQLRKEKSPALLEAINALELIQRYSKDGQHPTWAEVIEKEAAKREKKTSQSQK